MSALQAALCPFVWQHCLVPVVPCRLAELLAAPSPFIMGVLPETRPLEHLTDQEDVSRPAGGVEWAGGGLQLVTVVTGGGYNL